MLTMDMLPRVMPDFYCERFAEAVEEVVRRQEALSAESAITRFEESPFGGYVVYSVSAEAFAAALDDEVLSPSPGDLIMPPRTAYQ